MPALEDVRRALLQAPVLTDRERAMCVQLCELIADCSHRGAPGLWTYRTLASWLDIDPPSPELISAVNFLASAPKFRVLDMRLMFFDPEDPEMDGYKLDADEEARAFQEGRFFDPQTGQEVPNAAGSLVPYFVLHEDKNGD